MSVSDAATAACRAGAVVQPNELATRSALAIRDENISKRQSECHVRDQRGTRCFGRTTKFSEQRDDPVAIRVGEQRRGILGRDVSWRFMQTDYVVTSRVGRQ